MSGIRLDSVSVRFGESEVLRDVSLDLDARTIAVIGENGSGKSSFARLLGGLIGPTRGTMRILGLDSTAQARELRRRTAIVFSNPDTQILMPTVAEDVAFSLRADRLPRTELRERVAAALDRFGLTELHDHASHDLSGGQKQLLALCGAFIRRPDLVIADEPTAYLDARNARRVADHLFAPDGHRLVLVTHDLELARRCDTAVLFAHGRVAATGTPSAVVADYEAMLRC
ncbi:cobalt ABC transporter ATPase [Microbacterium mangrovi]|uniref:Cobalt ABC transporter ATPase n=1 Tax=Microbacterium mangrovi TaxID=1348253 RepID=A0A0B2A526_9MICO|nr:ABC transporter ATP-binding protein [Microbacterium mangrovi]KHK96854.1 cobalt ABC transporter ATPase [Microbacterium mangrovi]